MSDLLEMRRLIEKHTQGEQIFAEAKNLHKAILLDPIVRRCAVMLVALELAEEGVRKNADHSKA